LIELNWIAGHSIGISPGSCKLRATGEMIAMSMKLGFAVLTAACVVIGGAAGATAAEIKVLTAGAFKQVLLALVPDFEKQSSHKVIVDNGTAGQLKKRIEGGEVFDVAVITPAVVDDLAKTGKIAAGSRLNLASVGVGVVVKQGAPKPDVSTVDAFKRALLAAKSVAYIDPASGGSSGIYIDKLLERLGIADQVRPKAKLKKGGHVADLIVSGEAELGLHQISEIVPVKGAELVGPLPKEIQNITTYAAGLSASAKDKSAAEALIKALAGPAAAAVLKSKGMEPAS
jgi:molybdate transport system substrate-binding protein